MSGVLLPLLYPLFVVHGIIMVGWPGVGKTPALICMILAIGRYHICNLGLKVQPSWRRSKALDNFRYRIPQVYEGVFLDDSSREKIDLADLKSYLTAEEDQTCSGRYNDIKLVRGQVRAYAGNHVRAEDEPEPDNRRFITPEDMLKLRQHTFAGERDADVMAVLKRAIVFVFGKHALYLRLPREEASDGVIHRIVEDDIHLDVLANHDKHLFSDFKMGSTGKGEDFDVAVQREQEMVQKAFLSMEDMGQKRYVEYCNEKLKHHLQSPEPAPVVRWLPDPPSTPEDTAAPSDTLPFSVKLASRDASEKADNMPRPSSIRPLKDVSVTSKLLHAPRHLRLLLWNSQMLLRLQMPCLAVRVPTKLTQWLTHPATRWISRRMLMRRQPERCTTELVCITKCQVMGRGLILTQRRL